MCITDINNGREILSFIQKEGIINLSCVQEKMEMHKREELLNKQKEWAKNRFDYYSKL